MSPYIMPRYIMSPYIISLLLLCSPSTLAGLERKGMAINLHNRTPFTLRFVELAKSGSGGDWRIHFVKPNGSVHFQGKGAGYADDRDLNIFVQRFCPAVTGISQSALHDQYVQTAVISAGNPLVGM